VSFATIFEKKVTKDTFSRLKQVKKWGFSSSASFLDLVILGWEPRYDQFLSFCLGLCLGFPFFSSSLHCRELLKTYLCKKSFCRFSQDMLLIMFFFFLCLCVGGMVGCQWWPGVTRKR